MDKTATGQIVKADCLLGKMMLESGAEIYRVEQTMHYFLKSYGIHSGECSITSTQIIVSVVDQDGNPQTYMRNAKIRALNLNKIKLINELSRSLAVKAVPIEEVFAKLEEIEKGPYYKAGNALAV